jgi:hypothetical protein
MLRNNCGTEVVGFIGVSAEDASEMGRFRVEIPSGVSSYVAYSIVDSKRPSELFLAVSVEKRVKVYPLDLEAITSELVEYSVGDDCLTVSS